MTWAQLRIFAYGVAVEITYQICRPRRGLVHELRGCTRGDPSGGRGMSVQRFKWDALVGMAPADDGGWVKYADHERIVAEAVAAANDSWREHYREQLALAVEAERAACIADIEAVVPEENVFGINVVSTTALIAALRARGEQA